MRPNDEAEATPANPPRPGGEDAGPHVLVVDDEPQIRELVSTALRREGYRVTVRPDGRAALADIREQDVSILLTDLKMPRMNGLDLIRSAKQIRPDLGSILITAFSSTETAVQALRYGADDYLTKPFGLEDLRSVVGRVLTARRIARTEKDAVDRVREEADSLRRRHRQTEQELERAQEDLRLSRRDLERRVRDLQFLRELSHLLSRNRDLERVLQTTAGILSRRFGGVLTRIEIDLNEGIHVAEHKSGALPDRVLSTMGPDLLQRARNRSNGVLRDLVLGFGAPMEGLAAAVDVAGRPMGGLTILRPASDSCDAAGDEYLLSLVPQTLGAAIESELNRKAAEANALRVAAGIVDTLEGRGGFYPGHSDRVARIADRIAQRLELSPRLRSVIRTAARLHDVGEVGIPDHVLSRSGPLTAAEREVVQSHPVVGARILAPFGEAAAFVRHHRERPDGGGYPDGLSGDEIPLGAGIIGVAEAYDAMISPRPYRPSRSKRDALAEIAANAGSQFVQKAVDGLLSLPPDQI